MIHISTTDALSEDARQSICDELRRFNVENNGAFFAAWELPAMRRGRCMWWLAMGGRLIGGLLAETQFAWVKVSIMTVVESARGRGIGSRLLAARRGRQSSGVQVCVCGHDGVSGAGILRKVGYQLAGRLEDWDSHGHAKFFFVKRLGEGGQPAGGP